MTTTTRLAITGLTTALLFPLTAGAQPLDPERCAAGQPAIERLLQGDRERCLVRAARGAATHRPRRLERCERRAIDRYEARMRQIGCEVDDGRATSPVRRPGVETARAVVMLRGETAEVLYEKVGGRAVFQGDILLGTVEEVEAFDRRMRQLDGAGHAAAPSHTRGDFSWPRNVIPFEIASDLSSTMVTRINNAVAHWNANTIVRLQARNGETDFVRFVRDDDGSCLSRAGRQGGMQEIRLATVCSTGNVIHEIGHAVGLYHEQNRNDRDSFVIVNRQNIDPDPQIQAQFDKGPFGSLDVGTFDFNSRMLYGPFAFSDNGQATMTRLDGTTWTSNATVLSIGDIVGVTRMVTGLDGWLTPKDKFRNQGADRCLRADGSGSNAAVSIATCDGGSRRQRWLLYTHPRTNRRLLVGEDSGLCLDVPGGSTSSGTDLQLFPCHGGTNQAFTFTRPFAWDPWTIRNVNSNLCLALESTASGGDVEQRTCGTSNQQKWFQELL
jgi:hypothetical protein